jgi:hypothetical protein
MPLDSLQEDREQKATLGQSERKEQWEFRKRNLNQQRKNKLKTLKHAKTKQKNIFKAKKTF